MSVILHILKFALIEQDFFDLTAPDKIRADRHLDNRLRSVGTLISTF